MQQESLIKGKILECQKILTAVAIRFTRREDVVENYLVEKISKVMEIIYNIPNKEVFKNLKTSKDELFWSYLPDQLKISSLGGLNTLTENSKLREQNTQLKKLIGKSPLLDQLQTDNIDLNRQLKMQTEKTKNLEIINQKHKDELAEQGELWAENVKLQQQLNHSNATVNKSKAEIQNLNQQLSSQSMKTLTLETQLRNHQSLNDKLEKNNADLELLLQQVDTTIPL